MHRRAPLACLLAGLALSMGCASCASPWDYCGPVYAGGPCNTCVVDDRVGSAFTGGPGADFVDVGGEYYEGEVGYGDEGPYDGEGVYQDESAPYESPLEPGAQPMPTPADDAEPQPADDEPPFSTPVEPPMTDDTMPPDTMPQGDLESMPPLESPPSDGRRTSFTAPIKAAPSARTTTAVNSSAGGDWTGKRPAVKAKAVTPEVAKPAVAKSEVAKPTTQASAAAEPAAANAPAKTGSWQPSRSKSKFRR